MYEEKPDYSDEEIQNQDSRCHKIIMRYELKKKPLMSEISYDNSGIRIILKE